MPPRTRLPPPSLLRSRPIPRRSFTLPSLPSLPTSYQTLRARRLLPYPSGAIYSLIADVGSYAAFVPYCRRSVVTSLTADGRWPTRATLTVGYGPWAETYASRIYCVPGEVVEAVSGAEGRTEVPRDTLRRFGLRDEVGGEEETSLFHGLVTRWTVRNAAGSTVGGGVAEGHGNGKEQTEVELSIRFRFVNPAYALVAGQIKDDIAGKMVEAFERRARELFGERKQ